MTVYIEFVLVDNFIIDYLLLKATYATTGISVKKGRLFLCAFLGAIVALIYPLITIKPLSVALKVLCGLLLPLIAAEYETRRSYFVNTLIFFLYTFLTGGAIIGIFLVFGINYSAEISIALMFLPVYLLISGVREVIKHIYKQRTVFSCIYSVSLTLKGKTVNARGFMDTGNGVYDGENPVIVCGKRFFQTLIGDNFYKIKSKKITLSTVSGKSENFAFILDQLVIYLGDKPNIFNNVTLVVTKTVGDGYDVILHPAFLEDLYDKTDATSIKKIS